MRRRALLIISILVAALGAVVAVLVMRARSRSRPDSQPILEVMLSDPRRGAALLAELLSRPEATLRALDAYAELDERCLAQARAAARSPGAGPPLARSLRCLRAVQDLLPAARRAAQREPDRLLRCAEAPSTSGCDAHRGALLGLGLIAPTPTSVRLLARELAVPSSGRTAVESLTELGLVSPELLLSELRRVAATGLARLRLLHVEGRLAPDPAAACSGLARLLLAPERSLHDAALEALLELAPRCAAAAPVLLLPFVERWPDGRPMFRHNRRTLDPSDLEQLERAVRGLAATGLESLPAVERTRDTLLRANAPPSLVRALRQAMDDLLARDFLDRVGVSREVVEDPQAMQGLARPEVRSGGCPAGRVGLPDDESPPWLVGLSCVLEVKGGASELRAPLERWRARLGRGGRRHYPARGER